MGLKESGSTGRNTTESCDPQTGLLLQDPESMTQSPTRLNSVSVPSAESVLEIEQTSYGSTFMAVYTVMGHADSGGDTLTVDAMDPTASEGSPNGPAPFKFRVLRWWTLTGDVAGTPEGVLTIQHLSSADSPAANAMTEGFDLALHADDVGYSASGTGKLIDPYMVVDEGEGIRLSVVLGSNEEADFILFLECMRVQ